MIGYSLEEAFEAAGISKYYEIIIRSCYEQEHRKYHNLDHLCSMLRFVPRDLLGVEIVLEAILFHDIVYDLPPTPAGLNETLSAAEYTLYTLKTLSAMSSPFNVTKEGSFLHERSVIEAINATARHTDDQLHLSIFSKLVLDLDLANFAFKEEFESSTQKVKDEFMQRFDLPTYVKGQLFFLNKLLERKQIYYLKTEWEDSARENIQDEILRLIGNLGHLGGI